MDKVHVGQEFPPTPIDLSGEAVRRVLDSLEATLPQGADGADLVTPSAMASLWLGVLLRHVALPDGSLHVAQEIRLWRAIPVGTQAICEAVVASVATKAGVTLVSMDFNVESLAGDSGAVDQLATGSGTVMFPAGDS